MTSEKGKDSDSSDSSTEDDDEVMFGIKNSLFNHLCFMFLCDCFVYAQNLSIKQFLVSYILLSRVDRSQGKH